MELLGQMRVMLNLEPVIRQVRVHADIGQRRTELVRHLIDERDLLLSEPKLTPQVERYECSKQQ